MRRDLTNQYNFLYDNNADGNNGDGTFMKQTFQQAGSIVTDIGDFGAATWGDYDNDGWQDLYVITFDGGGNFLYHNNGDGTFSRVLSGSLVNDTGFMGAPAWGDYDNDGFLDLVVTRGVHDNSTNLLYHNNRNPNGWLKVKLVGTISNRSGIGAKVRVKAIIAGKPLWQLREINSGNGFTSGPLEAHFGLGDATNIDIVQIQWSSGIIQVMINLVPRQTLTVIEHQENALGEITITGTLRSTNGVVSFRASGNPGVLYRFEASTNLVSWTKLGIATNVTGVVEFLDPTASKFNRRFYRVSAP
jgi:hypothetical protein